MYIATIPPGKFHMTMKSKQDFKMVITAFSESTASEFNGRKMKTTQISTSTVDLRVKIQTGHIWNKSQTQYRFTNLISHIP
jgi:hypothetical protein